jgi:type II secretory pathway pseudopilin PulG
MTATATATAIMAAIDMMTTTKSPSSRRTCRKGMTLVEAMISTVIVGVMIAMVLHTFGSVAKGRRIQVDREVAAALARQLLSEVVQASYEDTGSSPDFGRESSEGGSSRAKCDDVDDYHNWSASPPEAKDGTEIGHLDGWARSVSVVYVNPANLSASGSDQGLKRVTVTVTDPRGATTSVVALRSEGGAYDLESTSENTYVTWIGVELQVGTDNRARIASGANVLNLVTVE